MREVRSTNQPVSSGHTWLRQHRSWLAIALLLLATLLCIALVDAAFERIDEPIENVPLVTSVSQMATTAGGRTGGTILALLVIILAGRRWWWHMGRSVVAGLVIQTTVVEVLKPLTGRPRPAQCDGLSIFYGPAGSEFHSFPSGHAAFAFMLATVAAAYFPRWRWPAYAGAGVIALSRVLLDRHFISDIMIGAFIGYIAAYLVLRWWPPRESGGDIQEILSPSEIGML